ncbi:MAG TPA: NUDIX hydrolase [Rhizobiales bacterium]|nr:NUDIX hydrolase [Hyphomicrobiales bacterium]
MARPRTPLLSVDCVILNTEGSPLLIRRKNPPFKGDWALPGGFVDCNESVEDAARRELMEETGLKAGRLHLIGVYSQPGRDPRGAIVSIAFLTRTGRQKPRAGDDAAVVEWVDNWREQKLAFDHFQIISDAVRLRRRL